MRYGARILFEDVTTTFLSGRRYAITGPNGAGKSTLMKILTGDSKPPRAPSRVPRSSACCVRISSRSTRFASSTPSSWATRRSGRRCRSAKNFYAKDHSDLTDEDGMRLGELEGIVGDEGGYTAESDAAVLLDGLDIRESLHERKMSELQGGQKVRVLLAQALFGNPSVLLLDEPTNHLDLDSVHWLQDYCSNYEGCLIVISHDRHFLNEVCTHMRRHRLRNRHHLHRRLRRHGARENADPLAHRSRKRAARKEDRAVERIHRAASPPGRAPLRSFRERRKWSGCRPRTWRGRTSSARTSAFDMERPSGRHPLEIKGLSKSYGDLPVIAKLHARASAAARRLRLIGRNGAGKTTLLKSLIRNAPGFVEERSKTFAIDAGRRHLGPRGLGRLFLAGSSESIPHGATLIDWLHEFDPMASQAGTARRAGSDAVQRRRCVEADRGAFRRRGRAPDISAA